MRTITFTDDLIYPVRDGVAAVKIRIHPVAGQPYEVDAILDTGASVSRFSSALAPDLGIPNVRAGHIDTFPAGAANNAVTTAYVHRVRIEFDGHMIDIKTAFCPDWGENVKNLLGLDDFFGKMLCGFEHRGHSFFYSLIS